MRTVQYLRRPASITIKRIFSVATIQRKHYDLPVFILFVTSVVFFFVLEQIAIMAVSSGMSFTLSSVLTVLLFSGMQLYRSWLASSQLSTILGGYLASVLFLLILTAIGNLETSVFGKNFQTKLFPEVIICLLIALLAAGMVHRVCVTTCLIFSLVSLYYVNRISQQVHATPVPVQATRSKQRK